MPAACRTFSTCAAATAPSGRSGSWPKRCSSWCIRWHRISLQSPARLVYPAPARKEKCAAAKPPRCVQNMPRSKKVPKHEQGKTDRTGRAGRQRLMMRARLNPLLRLRQQRFRHRQHRLRHRIRMRKGRHMVRRPRLQIRMRQGRHRARSRQTRMQQDRHRAHRHSSRQDRRSKCPQVVVSDVVICNQFTGL